MTSIISQSCRPESITKIVDEELIKARALNDEKFKVLEATKLWATLHGESNLEPKNYHRCITAHTRTLITPSGVYVCPYFRGADHKNLGLIQNMTFQELWMGKIRSEIIEKLDPSKDCPMHCIRNDSNIIIEQWIKGGFPCRARILIFSFKSLIRFLLNKKILPSDNLTLLESAQISLMIYIMRIRLIPNFRLFTE